MNVLTKNPKLSKCHIFFRFKYLYSGAKRMSNDGYNSLKYKRVKIELRRLYTWILVDLPHLKWSRNLCEKSAKMKQTLLDFVFPLCYCSLGFVLKPHPMENWSVLVNTQKSENLMVHPKTVTHYTQLYMIKYRLKVFLIDKNSARLSNNICIVITAPVTAFCQKL